VTDTAGTLSASATLTVKDAAEAANCLENPSFESGVYSPWVTFNGGGLKTNDEFYAASLCPITTEFLKRRGKWRRV